MVIVVVRSCDIVGVAEKLIEPSFVNELENVDVMEKVALLDPTPVSVDENVNDLDSVAVADGMSLRVSESVGVDEKVSLMLSSVGVINRLHVSVDVLVSELLDV